MPMNKGSMAQRGVSTRPLGESDTGMVQVLLDRFSLRPTERGVELSVEFTDDQATITDKEAKRALCRGRTPRQVRRQQTEIDKHLFGPAPAPLNHSEAKYPFRFASGGTLPILHLEGEVYYALFYRDIHPIGWNIANGACASRSELLDPTMAIERELREELLIFHPELKHRCIFDWDAGKPPDHADFQIANRVWSARFRQLHFGDLTEVELPLKWIDGPDELVVTYNDERRVTQNCFVNINAEDLGIEIDRIAWIRLEQGSVLCDGEINDGRLLNQVIGLFKTESFHKALCSRRRAFRPDRVFLGGRERPPENLDQAIMEYLAERDRVSPRSRQIRREYERCQHPLDLCPATRSLVRRYVEFAGRPEPGSSDGGRTHGQARFPRRSVPEHVDVFLSFPSEDADLAHEVYLHLKRCRWGVFFSDNLLAGRRFSDEIDRALDKARALVAVGRRVTHLEKEWVKYEWQSFHNDILNRRKSDSTPLIPFIAGFDPRDLPRPLRQRNAIRIVGSQTTASLQKLHRALSNALKTPSRVRRVTGRKTQKPRQDRGG